MFSYFGSKSKVIKRYPKPRYGLIIEPFAGSARYALLYYSRRIILNDKYRVIYNVWKYLISATREDIESLPELKEGEDLRDFELTEVERQFMGFIVCPGQSSPCNVYTKWAAGNRERRTPQIQITKARAIEYLEKIRHWKVFCRSYKNLPNVRGTWFIDAPYQNHGRYYQNRIDYKKLAEWCKSRKGQVIVCESGGADWLEFEPLCYSRSQAQGETAEVIWTKRS